MELDHVLIAVPDLEAAARELEASQGLASVEGGRHAGWGTANRIVPLGEAYLELITVVDEAEAPASAFGSWVADGIRSAPGRPLGWVARTDRIDEVAARLGLTVTSGSRAGRDGRRLHWRLAGPSRRRRSRRFRSSSSGERGRRFRAARRRPIRPARSGSRGWSSAATRSA